MPGDNINFDMFFRPFDLISWSCILAVFAIFFILNQLNQLILSKRIINAKLKQFQHQNLSWIGFCILLDQHYYKIRLLNISIKIIIIFWLLSAKSLNNLYSGRLSSMLAIRNKDEIDTVEKFAQACKSKDLIPLAHKQTSVFENLPVSFLI